METTLSALDQLTLTVRQEMRVQAPIEVTFDALLEQLGSGFDTPDGTAMPLMLEAWPGGRWFRDLGNGNGHWWGVVQAIKRPTLLELSGPMFMSYPVSANIQYRLTESNGVTVIAFHHLALGLISDEHRQGVDRGWSHIHAQVRARAERR
jgi:hypothetical protein